MIRSASKFPRRRFGWLAGLILMAATVVSPHARAASLVWTNTTGDFWQTGAAWTTNGGASGNAPGAGDSAFFTNSSAYNVTLNAGVLNLSSNYFNSGTITLNLAGNILSMTNALGAVNSGAGAFVLGYTANSTATVYLASSGAGLLSVSNGAGSARLIIGGLGGGALIVTNGMVMANQTILGDTATGIGSLLLSGNTFWTNTGAFTIGNASGSKNNSLVISNSASLNSAGTFTVGGGSSAFNTLTITNALLTTGLRTFVGNSSASNTATVQAGGTWNMLANNFEIGSNSIGNSFVINGGLVTNVGEFTLGFQATAYNNSLLITNGGKFFTGPAGTVFIGRDSSQSNNVMVVGGPGGTSSWDLSKLTLEVGYAQSNNKPGGYNNFTVGSGGLVTNAGNNAAFSLGVSIGLANTAASNSTSNRLIVTDGGKFFAATNIYIGEFLGNAATAGSSINSNQMWIGNTGLVSVAGGVYVGFTTNGASATGTASFNNLTITNGGQLLTTGRNGVGFNLFTSTGTGTTISNAVLIAGGGSSITSTSLWDAGGGSFIIGNPGNGVSRFNNVTVDGAGVNVGAMLTNVAGLTVGTGAGATANSFVVTNGGKLALSSGGLALGASGSASNSLVVAGGVATSMVDLGASALTVGNGSANSVIVDGQGLSSGAIISNVAGMTIGTGAGSYNNSLTITNGGKVAITSAGFTMGILGSLTNTLVVAGGASSSLLDLAPGSTFEIGYGAAAGVAAGYNTLIVGSGGVITNAGFDPGGANRGLGAEIGFSAFLGDNTTSNRLIVDGGKFLASTNVYIGHFWGVTGGTAGGMANSNQVVIANGGLMTVAGALYVGFTTNSAALKEGIASYNNLTITNGGQLFTSGGSGVGINVSSVGTANGVTISNTAFVIGSGQSGTATSLWNFGGSGLIVGGGFGSASIFTANYNRLVVDGMGISGGAMLTNIAGVGGVAAGIAVAVGGTPALGGSADYNSFIISNGAQVFVNNGETRIGDVGRYGNQMLVDDGTYVAGGAMFVGLALLQGGGVGGSNSLVISHGGYVSLTNLFVGEYISPNGGWGGSSNTVFVAGADGSGNKATLAFTSAGGMNIGSSSMASNNSVVVGNNGVITNGGLVFIGNSTNAVGNSLIVTNGGSLYSGNVTVGGVTGSSGNSYTIDGGSTGSTVSNGTIIVGAASSSFNTMTLTNASLQSQAVNIGNGGSNNTALVKDSSVWNVNGQAVSVGNGLAVNNSMTINSGTVTNVGAMAIGTGVAGTDYGNNLNVLNGGALYSGNITVGNSGSTNNAYNVGSTGAAAVVSNGVVVVGGAASGFNLMNVTNANLQTSGLVIGNGSSNNTVNVADGVNWNLQGGALKFGTGTGNVLNVGGAATVLTNVGGIILAGANQTFALTNASGAQARNILLGNGGSVSVGDTAGWGDNTFLLSNQLFTAAAASSIGNNSSNNSIVVLSDAIWNQGGLGMIIGTGAATGNTVVVNSGGLVTNLSALVISANNSLNMQGGTIQGTTVTNSGAINGVGQINNLVVNNASLNATNGLISLMSLTNSAAGFVNIAGDNSGTLNVQNDWVNAGSITNRGFLTGATLTNSGTLVGSMGATNANLTLNAGNLIVTNGIFTMSNGLTNAPTGYVKIAGGANSGTLNVVPDWNNAGVVTNLGQWIGGVVTNSGTIVSIGSTTPNGVVNGNLFQVLSSASAPSNFVNLSSGTLNAGAGGMLLLTNASWNNNLQGTLLASGGGVWELGNGVTNNGAAVVAAGSTGWVLGNAVAGALYNISSVFITNGASLQVLGTVTNASTGVITLNDGGSLLANLVTNTGIIQAMSGTGTVGGVVYNLGTIRSGANTGITNVLSFVGGIARNSGTIILSNNVAVINIGGSDQASANSSGMTMTNVGTIQFGKLLAAATGGTIHGNTTGVGILNQGLITAPVANPNSYIGVLDAAVINDTGGAITVNGGASGSSFSIASLATNKGNISITGVVGGGIFIGSGDVVNLGSITMSSPGNFAVPGMLINNGSISWTTTASDGSLGGGKGLLNNVGATFTMVNNGVQGGTAVLGTSVTNLGTMFLERSSSEPSAAPKVMFSGSSFYNNGTIDIIGPATTLLTGALPLHYYTSTWLNDTNGLIDVGAGSVYDTPLINFGTVRVESNAIATTAANYRNLNSMILGTSFNNNGTLDLRGGSFAATQLGNAAGATLRGFGDIGLETITNISGTMQIITAGDIVNQGTVAPAGIINAHNIINTNGGMIVGNGAITSLNITNTLTGTNSYNAGGLIYNTAGSGIFAQTNANGSTLVLSNGFGLQNGTIGATNGYGVLQIGNGSMDISNGGTIWLDRGGVLMSGTVTNSGTIQTITGIGTNSGAVLNQSSGTILAAGTLVLSNGFAGGNNAGSLIVSNNGTLRVGAGTPGILNNSGTANFFGGTLIAGTITNTSTGWVQLSGTGSGVITGGLQLVNAGTISLANGQTLTLSGVSLTNVIGSTLTVTNNSTLKFVNSSFLNMQNNSGDFNFDSGNLLFTNNATGLTVAGGVTNYLTAFGNAAAGTTFGATNNNFFVSNLTLSGGQLQLLPQTSGNALYVGNLTLAAGTLLDLDGMTIYYANSAVLNGTYQNGSIIQLSNLHGVQFNQSGGAPWDWDAGSNWTGGIAPATADDAFIVSSTSATVTYMTNALTQVASLTISNTSVQQLLAISNGVFNVTGTTLVGNNGVIQIGDGLATGTMSNQDITLAGTGQIVMTNTQAGTVNGWFVAGNFTNSAASRISFYGVSGSTNLFQLTASVFSNAGSVVSFSGTNIIQSLMAVNYGTNSLRGGTLAYEDLSGNPASLVNAGTILYDGGSLDVLSLTNLINGTLKVDAGFGTNANALVNFGTIDGGGGRFINVASMDLRGGTLTGVISNASGMFVTNGVTAFNGGLLNSGVLTLRSAGALAGGGTITNFSGATITAVAGGNITNFGANSPLIVNLSGGTIRAASGVLQVGGELDNAGLINATSNGVLSAANLYQLGNGVIRMNTGSVVVAGNFTNTTQSTITNVSGSLAALIFSAAQPVTNSGIMTFLDGGTTAGNTGMVVSVNGGGNTLQNNGTILEGLAAATTSRATVFSNQFVNTKSFTLTNGSATVAAANLFSQTGVAGGALTNAASGTIKLFGSATGLRNVMTLNSGGMVNLGTLNSEGVANGTNRIALASGQVFSNAAGGLVSVNGGALSILADQSANGGTNLLNSGTLQYLAANGGVGTMVNSGSILYNGGNLDVLTLTNTSSGVISNVSGPMVWNTGETLVNSGKIDAGNAVATNFGLYSLNGGGVLNGSFYNASSGTWLVTNGTTSVNGSWVNSGVLNLNTGTLNSTGVNTNFGFIVSPSSTGTVGGVVYNLGGTIGMGGNSGVTNMLSFVNGIPLNTGTILLSNSLAVLNIGGSDQASAMSSGLIMTNAGTIQFGLFSGGARTAAGTINANTNGVGILNLGNIDSPANAAAGTMNINSVVINGTNGESAAPIIGFLYTVGYVMNVYSIPTNFGIIQTLNINQTFNITHGDLNNYGFVNDSGGNPGFILAGTLYNNGSVNVADLGQTTPQNYTVAGTVNNPGGIFTFNNTGGGAFSGLNGVYAGGSFTNYGTLKIYRAANNVNRDAFALASGSILYNTGTVYAIGGTTAGAGVALTSAGETAMMLAFGITNGIGGSVITTNGAIFTPYGAFKNLGTIEVAANSVFGHGHGGVGVASSGTIVAGNQSFVNEGTVILHGNGNISSGSIFGSTLFTNTAGAMLQGNGQIGVVTFTNLTAAGLGQGYFVTVSDVANAGTISLNGEFNAGNIFNLSGGTIIGNGTVESLYVTNTAGGNAYGLANGEIQNNAGATLMAISNATGSTLELSNGFVNTVNSGTIGATNNGILQLGDGTMLLTNNGLIALNGGELRTGSLRNNGSIVLADGTNALTVSGTLSISNNTLMSLSNTVATITGTVTNQGILSITNSTATFVNTVNLTGTGRLYNATVNIAGLSGTGLITNHTGTSVLTISNSIGSVYDGVLLGNGLALLKSGLATQTLNGANSYDGGTTLKDGTLMIGNDGALGYGSLTMSGGTLASSGTRAITNAVNLASTGTMDTSSGDLTLGGIISNNGWLVKAGSGTLAVTNSNTYSGGTVVNSGTLEIRNNNALGIGNVTNNNANLLIGGSSALIAGNNLYINNGTLVVASGANNSAWNGTITLGNATANMMNTPGNLTINGTITGAGSLTKLGAGNLVVNNANNYTGGTVVNAGNFVMQNNAGAGVGSITVNGATMTLNVDSMNVSNTLTLINGTLGVANAPSGDTYAGAIILNNLGTISAASSLTAAGVISGGGGLVKSGSSKLTLTSANTFSGDTTVGAGTLLLSNTSALAFSTLNDNAGVVLLGGGITYFKLGGLAGTQNLSTTNMDGTAVSLDIGNNSSNTTYSGILSQAGSMTKSGVGTLTLSANNTYSGGTILSNGWLAAGNNNAFGSGFLTMAGGTLTVSGNRVLTNLVNLASDGMVDTAGNTLSLNNVISGASGLIKTGSGTLTLLATNTYVGATTINQGMLVLAQSLGLTNSTVTPNVNGGLIFSNGTSFLVGGLAGTGNFGLSNSAGTAIALSVGNNNGSTTYGGSISGNGSITKVGGGRLEVTGASTYTGGTMINGGTLSVNNITGSGLGSGDVTVNSGGTLGGTGIVSGAVTVNSGGRVAPGNSVGLLNVGSLNLTSGSILNYQFRSSPSPTDLTNDQIFVTSTDGLTLNGGGFNLLTETGTNPNNPSDSFTDLGTYYLIHYVGSLEGLGIPALSVLNGAVNRSYSFGDQNNFVTLTIGGQGQGWNGSAGSPWTWTTGGNWNGGIAPVQGDALLFDGNSGVNNINDFAANTWFNGITFNNTAGAFTLNGNPLNLRGNVVNLSSAAQTFNLDLVLDGGSRIFQNAGTVTINNTISQTGGSYGIVKTGPGTMILNGNDTYTGTTEIQGGALRAVQGVGLPSASNLKLNGGVFESHGTLTRSLGTSAGSLEWGANGGGFSANGGSLTVNIGGSGATMTWGSTANFITGSGTLMFSSGGADSTVIFVNPIDFNGAVRTIQVANGTASVDADLAGALSGNSSAGFIKTGTGTLRLSGNETYGGATFVNGGSLQVDGAMSAGGAVTLNPLTSLTGVGTIGRVITGSGTIAPGIGQGILTVSQLDPSAGLNFNFDFHNIGSPDYTQSSFSSNDVLRITNSSPFTVALGITNTVNLYVTATLAVGETNVFRGGFYTDANGNFDLSITGATYNVFVNNVAYGAPVFVRTVDETGTQFGGVNGYVMEFGVVGQTMQLVPEPGVLTLWLTSAFVFYAARRRSRKGRAGRKNPAPR